MLHVLGRPRLRSKRAVNYAESAPMKWSMKSPLGPTAKRKYDHKAAQPYYNESFEDKVIVWPSNVGHGRGGLGVFATRDIKAGT